MGLFSRRRDADPAPDPGPDVAEPGMATHDDVVDTGRPARPATAEPGAAERGRIARVVAALDGAGIDIDDLTALGAAFDAAYAAGTDSDDLVESFGLGIGEHLVRHGRMDWRLVTDVFGTDLGVVARRRELSVIPTNLVATRVVRGEVGWIPGVVGHLVRLGTD